MLKNAQELIILIAEDEDAHAELIRRNLGRAGLTNELLRFRDGEELLNFLFGRGAGPRREPDTAYLLLLDIKMPRIDGIEVLQQVKADPELCRMPVIMVTTTDDPREVARCHEIGCSNYITKPADYEKFTEAIRRLGLFLLVVKVPRLNGREG